MLKKHALLVSVILVLSAGAQGQNKLVYQNIENSSLTISFASEPDENQKTTNYFISEIARSIPKKIEYTQFVFSCVRTDRIYETDPGKFSSTFEINDVACSGDIYYKGFSVADVLIPTHCSFTFNVFADNAVPFYQTSTTNGKLGLGYNLMASHKFSDTSRVKKFNTRVDNFAFHYDQGSKERFVSKLKLIDDYFLSESAIDLCFKKIKSIDYSNTDMIIVYDISLKEVEKTAEELYNKNFPGNLDLVNYDPAHFIDSYNNLSETIFNTRYQLNLRLANLDKMYYEKGLEELKKNEKTKAETYFKRSILYNPDFVPSQLELAKISYANNDLNAAADKMSHILRKLNPSPEIYKQVILFTDTLYNKMLAVGNEYNTVQKYNEAIEIFEKCVSFCDSLTGYSCAGLHLKGLALARFGIYQSYLSVSQKAMDNGRPELAEIYISDARNYQKIYSSFIINDAEALSKLEKIMMTYVAKGDTLISKNKCEKGLSYLEKAKNISDKNKLSLPGSFDNSIRRAHSGIYQSMLKKCAEQIHSNQIETAGKTLDDAIDYQKKYAEIITPSKNIDSLQTKIKSFQYHVFISCGLITQNSNDHQTALQHFDQAKKLEQQYFFKRNPLLDSLIQVTAIPVITRQINIAEKLTAAKNLDAATALTDSISKSIVMHGLSNDTVLTAKARQLQKNIFDLRCGNAKELFDNYLKRADIAVAKQDFMASDSLYEKATIISDSFPKCHIDASPAIEGKKMYLLPRNYQHMLLMASNAMIQHDYNSFFYNYSEAEAFFKNMQLHSFGMVHQLLSDKVTMSSDTTFVLSATDFMIQKNRPDDALQCIKRLEKLNFSSARTKNMQLQAGGIMARKDHAINAAAQPSVLIVSYTGNNKWLKYFKSSYIKTWKSLNK